MEAEGLSAVEHLPAPLLAPPFAGSGVLRAVTSAASLADALAGTPTVDDALRRCSEAQLQTDAQVIPNTEGIERSYVFGMPDLTAMPTTATNDKMSAAYLGLAITFPGVLMRRPLSQTREIAGQRA